MAERRKYPVIFASIKDQNKVANEFFLVQKKFFLNQKNIFFVLFLMRFHINVRRWYNTRGRLRTYTGAHAITPGRTRAHVKT